MGFKEMLSNMIEKKKQKNAVLKEFEEKDKAIKTIERKQKSAEELELENYMKQNHKEAVRKRLEVEREKRSHTKNIFENVHPLKVGNVFSGQSINQKSIFGGF